VAERLVSWSAGNPLFVEQIMAALDDGSLDEVTPPQSIQTRLASRVDQLPDHERAALTYAAVEGRLFHRGALHALIAAGQQTNLDAALLALVRSSSSAPTGPSSPATTRIDSCMHWSGTPPTTPSPSDVARRFTNATPTGSSANQSRSQRSRSCLPTTWNRHTASGSPSA
jgi:hypothetical protein